MAQEGQMEIAEDHSGEKTKLEKLIHEQGLWQTDQDMTSIIKALFKLHDVFCPHPEEDLEAWAEGHKKFVEAIGPRVVIIMDGVAGFEVG